MQIHKYILSVVWGGGYFFGKLETYGKYTSKFSLDYLLIKKEVASSKSTH